MSAEEFLRLYSVQELMSRMSPLHVTITDVACELLAEAEAKGIEVKGNITYALKRIWMDGPDTME